MSYNTKQKQLLLDLLKKNKEKHLTVEEMQELLRSDGVALGTATIYRGLDYLYKNGLLRKYITSNNAKACYQYVDDSCPTKSHFHLVCSKCQALIHLECDEVEEFIHHIEESHNFTIDVSKTVFYGLCEDCK